MGGHIRVQRDDSVATLWIDNPAQRNALTPAMLATIPGHLDELAGDGGTRVVVLRGVDGIFSSGYAIDHIGSGSELPYPDEVSETCLALERSPLPVVAVLERFAVGAALEVVCACDFRLATRDTKLGITPAKLGLVYSWTGMARIVRVVGLPAAKELFLTARLMEAEDAARLHLLTSVHPDTAGLEAAVAELCDRLSGLAPLSLAGSKRVFHELSQAVQLPEPLGRELHGLRVAAMDSEDAHEARVAFKERRPGRFRGR